MQLFHVSEDNTIRQFDPRPSDLTTTPVVWAIAADRLVNYLLPRDCPRITFWAAETTSKGDRDRFLGDSRHVIAVESVWYARIVSARLYCYVMPSASFQLIDPIAGYYVSPVAIVPDEMISVVDVVTDLLTRRVELRFMPSLWTLYDSVVESTLQFSIIRMRNAQSRKESVDLAI